MFHNKNISMKCCELLRTVMHSTHEFLLSPSTKVNTMVSDTEAEQSVLNVEAIPCAFLKNACCLNLTVLGDEK